MSRVRSRTASSAAYFRDHPTMLSYRFSRVPPVACLAAITIAAGACERTTAPNVTAGGACSASGTVQLAVNQAARIDCSGGGTSVTLAGGGASYLIVPQFAVSLVQNTLTGFRLTSIAS